MLLTPDTTLRQLLDEYQDPVDLWTGTVTDGRRVVMLVHPEDRRQCRVYDATTFEEITTVPMDRVPPSMAMAGVLRLLPNYLSRGLGLLVGAVQGLREHLGEGDVLVLTQPFSTEPSGAGRKQEVAQMEVMCAGISELLGVPVVQVSGMDLHVVRAGDTVALTEASAAEAEKLGAKVGANSTVRILSKAGRYAMDRNGRLVPLGDAAEG